MSRAPDEIRDSAEARQRAERGWPPRYVHSKKRGSQERVRLTSKAYELIRLELELDGYYSL